MREQHQGESAASATMPRDDVALEVTSVSKYFPGKGGDIRAIDNVSFRLAENDFVSLVGPSGCGKSTLLNIIAGLEDPSSGLVTLDGEQIEGPGRDRGMVFQAYTLFPWLSVYDNVSFALAQERLSGKESDTRVREQLDLVGLTPFANAHPRQLSGGMKQRVALARSLVYRPRILLMDEPFGALDAQTRSSMQELLSEVWEAHRITVLFVTHDVEEAVFLSDRVIVMSPHPGRVQREVQVPLPRPRRFETQVSIEFLHTKAEIMDLIRRDGGDARGHDGTPQQGRGEGAPPGGGAG